jgi:catechol 2,3-dioxygenase-like lactoylglutathione lyase family enzyme
VTFAVDRIDHVVLSCRDVEQTVDWYVRVLGVKREAFGEDRVARVLGRQKINVRPSGAHLRVCGVPTTEGPVAKTGAQGPMTSHYCRDPDGNPIEIASYRIPH